MCGRGVLEDLRQALLEDLRIQDVVLRTPLPRYNIAPTTEVATILASTPNALQGTSWGIRHPQTNQPVFNARLDSIDGPMWRNYSPLKCIQIFSHFYEWKLGDKGAPNLISREDGAEFIMAGVHDGEGRSATLTTEPNNQMAEMHNRMPVVLEHDEIQPYLAGELSFDSLRKRSTRLRFQPVSTLVNSVRNQGAELILPWRNPQAKLF